MSAELLCSVPFWIIMIVTVIFIVGNLVSKREERLEAEKYNSSINEAPSSYPLPSPPVHSSRPQPKRNKRRETPLLVERKKALAQLSYPHAAFINLLQNRAIALYQQQQDVSWYEAIHAIDQLKYFMRMEQDAPVVVDLLLKKEYTDDALEFLLDYVGMNVEDAQEYIRERLTPELFQQPFEDIVARGDKSGYPSFACISFLLKRDQRMLAVFYYRARTGESIKNARAAVESWEPYL